MDQKSAGVMHRYSMFTILKWPPNTAKMIDGDMSLLRDTPRVNDPYMHHGGTCVTHVSWCMPGSLTSGFLWSRWRRKRSRYFRRMRNTPFCVSGKRLMQERPSYAPLSWRSILMCNKSTSSGTSLEGTPMFAPVTLHLTFNPLGSKCPWWQDVEAASEGP